ncbi:uncharacterized protein F4807DRAFT_469408 [Annulohypoxylon truncatum]|uniref:uncharacterized protein n=1 Tax=Annulohypoxylon truncatum TaxID=327061 RepID=UPI002007C66D|nr:uncharacterized protein F4807DRAFT_469408 [Annulohypoxylon truncatum]KAI1207127.1 hypothetical protein F4807DRAFT_469408 [Annulohypoxylon truncatum]
MANLPSQHPHLSLHLSDRALTPLITSARTQYQLDALTSLSHGALSAHESALRLGLGTPQRIVVEHAGSGPVVLQSFLRADSRPSSSSATTAAAANTTNAPPSRHTNNNNNNPSSSHTPGTTTPAAPPNGLGLNPHDPPSPSPSPSEPSTPVSPSASPTATAIERRLAQLQLQHGTTNNTNSIDDASSSPEDANAPPMLVGLVVSPSADEARDARRAAARLERVGREIQARWAEAQAGSEDEDEDGREEQAQGRGQGRGGARSGAGAGDAGD